MAHYFPQCSTIKTFWVRKTLWNNVEMKVFWHSIISWSHFSSQTFCSCSVVMNWTVFCLMWPQTVCLWNTGMMKPRLTFLTDILNEFIKIRMCGIKAAFQVAGRWISKECKERQMFQVFESSWLTHHCLVPKPHIVPLKTKQPNPPSSFST